MDLLKRGWKLGGKENKIGLVDGKKGKLDCYSILKLVLKLWNLSINLSNKLKKVSFFDSLWKSIFGVLILRRRSFSLLFDLELIDLIEKELFLF